MEEDYNFVEVWHTFNTSQAFFSYPQKNKSER